MTYRRYEIIKQNLHFCDNSVQPPKGSQNFDRAFKVRQLTDHFNQIAPKVYQYEETVSVDEHMIKFKGNNAMKQYMKGKPVSWGFKLWLLASAKTGYVYKMDLYTGASEKGKEGSLAENVVLKMTKELENSGIIVGMDNFFSSVPLFQKLRNLKIKAVGTVRTNRKMLPSKVKDAKTMKENEVHAFVTEDKTLSCTIWMDKRPVIVISNFIDSFAMTTVERRKRGQAGKMQKQIPKIVSTYNFSMKGVDLADQRKAAYEIDRRSACKFYLRIFFDMLDLFICNAYVVYGSLNLDSMTSLDFRRAVAMSLLKDFSSREREIVVGPLQSA